MKHVKLCSKHMPAAASIDPSTKSASLLDSIIQDFSAFVLLNQLVDGRFIFRWDMLKG